MSNEHPSTPSANDPVRDAIRHRRDTADQARVAALRADILAAATAAPLTDDDLDNDPRNKFGDDGNRNGLGQTRRRWGARRRYLGAAAVLLVVAAATIAIVTGQRMAEATARMVLIEAADATNAGGTARYEMSLPFSISFDSDPGAEPLARYTLECTVDFDFEAPGSLGRCESRRVDGPPLFDFLEDEYEILTLGDLEYERDGPGDPWALSTTTNMGSSFEELTNLLDPISSLNFFTSDSADMAIGTVTEVDGTDTRRVETTVTVPLKTDIADAIVVADIVALIDADDQVVRLDATGESRTDVPFASRWPFELSIVRTAVDIDVDLPLDLP